MTHFYFDSSGLVKLYIAEPGTPWVMSVFAARRDDGSWAHTISLARIGIVEVAAAIAKRQRTGDISRKQQRTFVANFLRDCQERFHRIANDEPSVTLAIDLTQRHSLRGYDAVHLATALRLQEALVAADLPPIVFVAADRTLCDAAITEGLAVVNPNEIAVEGHSDT